MLQGMVQAAAYIYRKLKQESLLERAFNWNVAEGTDKFPLVSIFFILFFFLHFTFLFECLSLSFVSGFEPRELT